MGIQILSSGASLSYSSPTRSIAMEFRHESFAEQQDSVHTRIEESLAKLLAAVTGARVKEPPDPQATETMKGGWHIPPSLTRAPPDASSATLPRLRLEPPRFDGANAPDWIDKIQRYYNHHYTPLNDRLELIHYLFDHPASAWLEYWLETNKEKSWDDFLLAVKQRFDHEFYKPYELNASSPGPFTRTEGTIRDQRQLNGTTVIPEPDRLPHRRNKDVTQVIVDNQFCVNPFTVEPSNIFSDDSKSIIGDGSMNMESPNNIISNELGFDTMDAIKDVDPHWNRDDGKLRVEARQISGVSGEVTGVPIVSDEHQTETICDDQVVAMDSPALVAISQSSLVAATQIYLMEEMVFDRSLDEHNVAPDSHFVEQVVDGCLAHIKAPRSDDLDNVPKWQKPKGLVVTWSPKDHLLDLCSKDWEWKCAAILQVDAYRGVHTFDPGAGSFEADDSRTGVNSSRLQLHPQSHKHCHCCERLSKHIDGGSAVTNLIQHPVGVEISAYTSKGMCTTGNLSVVRKSAFKPSRPSQLEGSLIIGRLPSFASIPVSEIGRAQSSFAYDGLEKVVPAIRSFIHKELNRQSRSLEPIASGNFTARAVMRTFCSCLTNNYSEGLLIRRYVGGNVFSNGLEIICQEKALTDFTLDGNKWGVGDQSFRSLHCQGTFPWFLPMKAGSLDPSTFSGQSFMEFQENIPIVSTSQLQNQRLERPHSHPSFSLDAQANIFISPARMLRHPPPDRLLFSHHLESAPPLQFYTCYPINRDDKPMEVNSFHSIGFSSTAVESSPILQSKSTKGMEYVDRAENLANISPSIVVRTTYPKIEHHMKLVRARQHCCSVFLTSALRARRFSSVGELIGTQSTPPRGWRSSRITAPKN